MFECLSHAPGSRAFAGTDAIYGDLCGLHLVTPYSGSEKAFRVHLQLQGLLRRRVKSDEAAACCRALADHFKARYEVTAGDQQRSWLHERVHYLSQVDADAAAEIAVHAADAALAASRISQAEAVLSSLCRCPANPAASARVSLRWTRVYLRKGAADRALDVSKAAVCLLGRALSKPADDPELRFLLGCMLRRKGAALWEQGKMVQSARACGQSVRAFDRAIQSPAFSNAETWNQRGNALWQQASALRELASYAQVLEISDEAMLSCRRAQGYANQTHVDAWVNAVIAASVKATALYDLCRYSDSIASADEAIAAADKALLLRQSDPESRIDRAYALISKAESLHELARYEETVVTCDEAVRDSDKALAATEGRHEVAWNNRGYALRTKCDALCAMDDLETSLHVSQQAVECMDRVLVLSNQNDITAWVNRGRALDSQARSLARLGRHEFAVAACEDAASSFDRAITLSEGQDVESWTNRGGVLAIEAAVLNCDQRYSEAIEASERALFSLDRARALTVGQDPRVFSSRARVLVAQSEAFRSQGQWDRAMAAADQAMSDCDVALRETTNLDSSAWTQRGLAELEAAEVSLHQHLLNEAADYLDRALASFHQVRMADVAVGRRATERVAAKILSLADTPELRARVEAITNSAA